MHHVGKLLKRLRPRTRRGAIATVAVLLVGCVGTAFAYYVLTGGSGSGSATLGGAGTGGGLVLNVAFDPGLMPGQSEPVDVKASNPTSGTYEINNISETAITTSDPTDCLASWFTFTPGTNGTSVINGLGTPATVQPSGTWDWGTQIGSSNGNAWGTLAFTNLTNTDQSACENATVTIAAVAS